MAEKLILSNRAILKIHTGLRNLDGVASEAGKITRFDFDENVTWNIAKNIVLVERALEAYERARKSLLAKHAIVEGVQHQITEENAGKYATFMEEIEKLKDKQVEITGVLKLKKTELKEGGLNVPSIFADLMEIIKE